MPGTKRLIAGSHSSFFNLISFGSSVFIFTKNPGPLNKNWLVPKHLKIDTTFKCLLQITNRLTDSLWYLPHFRGLFYCRKANELVYRTMLTHVYGETPSRDSQFQMILGSNSSWFRCNFSVWTFACSPSMYWHVYVVCSNPKRHAC